MRGDDPYIPYATAEQISNNNTGVKVCDQVNTDVAMYLDPDIFLLGSLVVGRQGGGKSSAVFNILSQINVPMLLLDPKGTWRFRAAALGATYIEASDRVFGLRPPDGVSWEDYLFSELEGLAQVTGLQYGLDPLLEASQIALAQRQEYIDRTGEQTPLCLRDIYVCLPLTSFRSAKQSQYLISAQTALHLIVGTGDLFATRGGGLPLDLLLKGRYIIDCSFLSAAQCRYLGFHILNYAFHSCHGLPETNQLTGLTVIDDSSKFINRPDNVFGAGPRTSPWMHLLATLRSTGRGTLFVDQLVAPILDDVKQLCSFWMVVGGLRDTRNHSEVAAAMSLDEDEAKVLGKLQARECIVYCPVHYPRAVRGTVPEVPPIDNEAFS